MYIGLLFAVAIILILCYHLFKSYYKKPILDDSTEKSLSSQGIDTSSYHSIVDDTRRKVKDIEKKLLEQEQELQDTK